LGISKSTVHGIAAALEAQGAVLRDSATKKYTIGPTLMTLGKAAYEKIDFKNMARPFLEKLMEQCQESVFLGIRNGNSVTVIDIVESRKDFKISSPIGTSLPLLAGAVGKVFLSLMTPKDRAEYLTANPLSRYTPHSIVDEKKYESEIKIVQQKGYATDNEEYISGVRAVAAPLKNHGAYMPAIWVVGFKASMTKNKIQSIVDLTTATADKINKKISSQP
jgi:DNA-binding IclR family transcriptional regulator